MRLLITLLLLGVLKGSFATPALYAFVSFSMPKPLLEQTLNDCVSLNIPAYLNGLHHNSMKETAVKVMQITKRVPGLNLQIDPVAFERFGIKQVPALVVQNNQVFDVIYGNLPLQEGLSRIAAKGETKLAQTMARSKRSG